MNERSENVVLPTDSNDGPLHAQLERTEGVVTDDKVHIVRYFFSEGITKRELFAAMAMQALAPQFVNGGDFMETHVAVGAIALADALLKELAK